VCVGNTWFIVVHRKMVSVMVEGVSSYAMVVSRYVFFSPGNSAQVTHLKNNMSGVLINQKVKSSQRQNLLILSICFTFDATARMFLLLWPFWIRFSDLTCPKKGILLPLTLFKCFSGCICNVVVFSSSKYNSGTPLCGGLT
jgi:hypothetical protein